ncbi:laccase-6 [Quercus suber]|uniref:laccase n=1 Tax=Quercus suber TaxID=58331 RepID=A0AAW0K8E3_QUESU
MANLATSLLVLWLSLISYAYNVHATRMAHWPRGSSTRFYDFKIQTTKITKLCNTKELVTVNGIFPGPVIYAQEDDRIIVKITNETPYNTTIHWYVNPINAWSQAETIMLVRWAFVHHTVSNSVWPNFYVRVHIGESKGHLFLACSCFLAPGHTLWSLRGISKARGEYYNKDVVQLERATVASGGNPPITDAYTINGHPGPNYNCSNNDVYKIDVVPGKTYLLRLINAGLNSENFFAIANHKLTIVEADAEYTKPFTTERVMLGPGQTINVLVTANQPIGKYSMAMGPYSSAKGAAFQNISAIAHFQYIGAVTNSVSLPAQLPSFSDNLAVKTVMDGLKSLNTVNVPKEIDANLFITIGLNVQKCQSKTPNQNCQGLNNGVMAASMNNISFIKPQISLLEAYYKKINGSFTEDFPGVPLKFYDFVNGAPNNIPNDTQALNGTRVKVLEYGTRVQLILQDTGTVTTENHPIHLHGYSFYVVGYGTGNYNPQTANFNLVDPPYMNTIGVPADIHQTWGLGTSFIVKNGEGVLETLPHPPADLPRC